MCGLVAIFSQGEPVSAELLERGLSRLHHRGPDGSAVWVAAHGRVGLGHARLSIIDLEGGAQPIASEDGDLRIAVNGEFYDFERERARLERRGHRFRTRSDSEIALHLFQDLGLRSVAQLRGEFAFVLWDEAHRRLIACRDRYGAKPLYYAWHRDRLYLASEVKALFAAGVPASWDVESMVRGSALRGPSRTFYAGVRAVPPGHWLLVDDQGLRLEPYWDVDYPRSGAARTDRPEGDWVSAFRSELEQAVRLRLRADVPVACYLSGGIDSCAILGLAAQQMTKPLHAFTLRFESADFDEGGIARDMAALAGAAYDPIVVSEDGLAENLSDSVFHAEQPFSNAHGVAKYLLSRAVRDAGYKVVLTGEGADEVLAGYPHFRVDLLVQEYDKLGDEAVRDRMGEILAANGVSMGLLLPRKTGDLSPGLKDLLGRSPTWMHQHFTAWDDRIAVYRDVADSERARDPAQILLAELDLTARAKGRSPLNQALYLWAKTMLPNYILTVLGDRAEMAHSVEGRLPFLDHRLGEFLQAVPSDLKIRGMTEKYLLREAVRDVVTPELYRRQKHPFVAPPMGLEPGGRLYELTRDVLTSQAAAAVPFLNSAALRSLADGLPKLAPKQRRALSGRILRALSTILLHQRLGLAG
ncbi:asparagine synthase (glutamine-hydrolyzing) [Pelagibius sp.]|uniref:asparagine synthase (glutamine-hydrolyzing) n=1 Tax=Pelagibius sp. TaxID=1931238 RepID=UPI00261E301F|nr:asparagine synthase (glutamine-hydrolyzing) [Pelagibius sp.]